ncbi:MAG: protein phosphatase 2C domain-containing protein [Gemmatimonadota bacterium]
MSHRGRVRNENQDHFLVGVLGEERLHVTATSLDRPPEGVQGTSPPVFLAMVADGVGGGPRGEEASRRTIAGVVPELAEKLHRARNGGEDGPAVIRTLSEAALSRTRALLELGELEPASRGMATTLSLWVGMWPRSYLLQVGDSRYYVLRDGRLRQISRDQTVAQDLLDRGAISPGGATDPRLANTLSSAIGGVETRPVVTPVEDGWGVVHLLCSDGLTRHVPDDRIQELLAGAATSRDVAEQLVEEALAGGGTDNITVVVIRTPPR